MDLVAVNKDPAFRHTPLGRMHLEPLAGGKQCAVKTTHWATGERAFIGVTGGTQFDERMPFDAFCGKRTWEAVKVIELAEKRKAREQAARDFLVDESARDMRREIDKKLAASVDGRDMLIKAFMGARR